MDNFDFLVSYKDFLKFIYDYSLDKSNEYLKNKDENIINIFKNFYYNLADYEPDISGYTLFFLIPPHLSSNEYTRFMGTPDKLKRFFTYLNSAVPFLAVDITPPTRQVKTSEYDLRVGGIPLADEVTTSNDLTVQYLETKEQYVYTLHSLWLEYIDEVKRGIIKPGNYISSSSPLKPILGVSSDYIADGNVDYMTAAYILKFSPDFRLTYFARATGIFPISLTPKDIIGSRANNDLTLLNVSYTCTFYNEFLYPELEKNGVTIENPGNNIFLKDFKEKLHNFLINAT